MNKSIKILTGITSVLLATGSLSTMSIHAENTDFTITSNGQTISIPSSQEYGNESYHKFLKEAKNFGVVANEWAFNGESETNAAVKSFVHQNSSGGQTGLTDKAEGSIHGYSIIGSVDNPFMVKGVSETIITPEAEKDKFINSTSGKIDFDFRSIDEINTKIDTIRNHAEDESNRMVALDSIKDYSTIPSNQMTLDVASAGKQTVYINIDKSEGLKNLLKQSSGLTIRKNPGQVVVLNFNDEDVNINKLEIEQDGQKYGGDSLANVSTSKNTIAEEVVFNMPNAKTAELHNVTGVVLAPQAKVDTYDVSGGWIVADKFVNHCEHHFTNGKMPETISIFESNDSKPSGTPIDQHKADEKPQPTVEPDKESEPTVTPTADSTEKPVETEEPVKPTSEDTPVSSETPELSKNPEESESEQIEPEQVKSELPPLKKTTFRVHAFEVKNNVAKPEENLKIEVTKTNYEIPEKEQNKSDKEDTRTSEEINVNEVKTLTTNSEGNTETELDKGSYKVEAKRENAPVVEKADKTEVYVHSDATLTGNDIEEGNKFTVKKIVNEEPIPAKSLKDTETHVSKEKLQHIAKTIEKPTKPITETTESSKSTVQPTENTTSIEKPVNPKEKPVLKETTQKSAVNNNSKFEKATTGVKTDKRIYMAIGVIAIGFLILTVNLKHSA